MFDARIEHVCYAAQLRNRDQWSPDNSEQSMGDAVTCH